MHKLSITSLIILFCILIPFIGFAQGQARAPWYNFDFAYTSDFVRNFNGGKATGGAFLGMGQLGLTLNTTKMGLWRNGEIFLHGLLTHGDCPSQDLIGDFQVASNIDAGYYPGLFEFWYRHQIGSKLTILAGQHDLNADFLVCETAGLFLNSAFGIHSSISLNVPVSIFPVAALGLMADYKISKNFNLKAGIYDGDPGDTESNKYNLQIGLGRNEGSFRIGEIAWNFGGKLKSEFKTGGYWHSGSFTSFSDPELVYENNYGTYLIVDQQLWQSNEESSTRSINSFLQVGWSPEDRSSNQYYLGGGITLQDLLGKNQVDIIGLSFAHASFATPFTRSLSSEINPIDAETAVELTWQLMLLPYLVIQPDLQYIFNPGLNGNDNALAGIFRTYWTFL